jgi:23S rRNA-/tRNA-specific pseudouridylate synthase
MASIGSPLAGDPRYGDAAWNARLRREAGLERLFLHCREAVLLHPATGRQLRVASPLPSELAASLGRLGLAR